VIDMTTFTGTAAANHIIGTAGADIINGYGGNDLLEGSSGNDTINGGAGNDRIVGGRGHDVLTGGAGSDTFVYASAADSPGSSQGAGDLITNWNPEDHIDLSAIDANSLISGNQAFHFAGYAFNDEYLWHGAGNLYIGGSGTDLWIIGYTNNDWTPDLFISLNAPLGEGSLTAGDLIF
jgi:Ca2+-binding RTX toxin-like protein